MVHHETRACVHIEMMQGDTKNQLKKRSEIFAKSLLPEIFAGDLHFKRTESSVA